MTSLDFKFAVIEACRSRFAEMQGHAPADLYEDGYADACADCVTAIERIPLPDFLSPPERRGGDGELTKGG